jgi:(1->4)-alpha-D-glucan 1-alpha-D-glucosylmutase
MTRAAPSIPNATYRLQFNRNFTFRAACEIVPYLHALGISHVYASPYFKAGPGSPHGYDICDHNELNPEVGSRADYDAFVAELHAHGMGQIVDFVPNHMSIGTPLNAWWMDVLENGPSSIYAPHFDIDWQPVKTALENKVLLPILGDQYGRALERGEFKLDFDGGAFFVRYFETKLPVAPRGYAMILKPALEKIAARETAAEVQPELQSIMTALDHLPARTAADPEKIAERAREKEIIKRRLVRVCGESAGVREAIDATLREFEGRAGNPRSFDALDALLNAQVYRLSYWRVAAEEINYRRFFDINDLAAIRVELPDVFEATHRLLFELIDSGAVNGVRVDHVDGLWHPREYLEKVAQASGLRPAANDEANEPSQARGLRYFVVEKIRLGDEPLRPDWPVHGTTGYDFANQVTGLFVDSAAEKSISETYQRFIGDSPRFTNLVYEKKQLVMRLALASEVNMLGHMLDRLSEKNRLYRDFTLNAITTAVREVIASFPIYRTYVAPNEEPDEADREAILRAVSLAKRRNPGVERSVFNFLGEILLNKLPENTTDAAREEHTRFVMKFQQCTGPVMAKGLEDTAFYVYNRLVALNEVGGEPRRFGISAEAFHERCAARLRSHRHAMLATSTHDTKRSEDTRARIAAISELPGLWRRSLRHWRTINRHFAREIEGDRAPDANEEYLLYQTLLGTWPLGSGSRFQPLAGSAADSPSGPGNQHAGDSPKRQDAASTTWDRDAHEAYVRRIQEYMLKAIKEAKVNSSWIQPNDDWEAAVRGFVAKILRRGRNRFTKSFEPVAQQIARLGAVNSLAQLVLKSTVPGVPDFYQGCELWDFSLVDPDNRRPVDYEERKRAMESLAGASAAELFANWPDGRIKLFVTRALLDFRREHARLFQSGDFAPLRVTGQFSQCCVAFKRRFENESLLVVAARLTQRVGFPPVGDAWRDTAIELTAAADRSRGPMRELFTGREITPGAATLPAADALRELPVAVYLEV